jgi:hypothetical protein
VKTVASTLGVARSNIIERRDGRRAKRGPQIRAGDVELARSSRASGDPPARLRSTPNASSG